MNRILSFSKISMPAVLLIAMLFTACKKDKEVVSNSVQGGWRNITSPRAEPAYYVFTADKKLYRLDYDDDYKQTQFAIYKATASQITIQDKNGTKLYNIRYTGDTLFLNDGNQDVVTLVKDNLAPKAITDWASSITITDRFTDTAKVTTIAYYSNALYAFKYYSVGSKMLKYNTSAHTLTLSNSDNAYQCADFGADGTMWCVLWQNAYKFDPVAGIQTFKSDDLTSNSLWATAVNGSTLYNYATATYISYDAVTDDWGYKKAVNNDVTDLAYAGGFLYVAKAGMIYKMHPFYALPVNSWYLENFEVRGIAFTGNDFWLAAVNNATEEHEMLRVTLN